MVLEEDELREYSGIYAEYGYEDVEPRVVYETIDDQIQQLMG